ncbi:uncharacterized protein GGS22DRAFT_172423 [Annulohypoxylon maeteangense]|uniref:uncharacterized protein n=1 Tax=Annulohypoxylon maeteangense TaxID=1927788 RepID=UPI002008D41B|nr:uncharacterized protein GGS22DRAFT_172423 [Annulohypoxylon maeteangense]KAI0881533.1 hypothetical protein GGS22DRAFT_172423 [Annulohypoxylon maeteangense]
MFGIWRHDPDSRGGGNIRQSFVPANVRVNPQQSCKNCRAKKLKTGCSRCKTLNSIIRYAKPSENGKYRRKPQTSKKPNNYQDWTFDGINEDAGPEPYECPPGTPAAENWTIPIAMEFEDHENKIIQESHPQYITPDQTPRTTITSTDKDHDSSHKTPPLQAPDILSTALPDEIDISSWIRSPVSLGDPGPELTGLSGAETGEELEAATTSPSLPTSHITTPSSSRNQNLKFTHSETSSNAGNSQDRNISIDSSSSAPILQCSCLARVVLLLDELESPSDNPEGISSRHSLDSILASIKETLSHAGAMLLCSLCTTKMENMTILAFLFSHLANTCQVIAEKYPHDTELTHFHRSFATYGRYDWPSLPRHGDAGAREGSDDYFHAYGFGGGGEGDGRETLVGEYEVDSPQEWRALMRALASLQLQQLGSMMQVMKTVPIVAGCKSLLRRLTAAESRLAGIKLRIQKRGAEL